MKMSVSYVEKLDQTESSSDLGEIIKVMRGLHTLRNASAEREDGLLEFLNSSEFVYAHSTCRQKYIHNKYIQIYKNKGNTASVPSAYSPSKKRLRNILSTDFNWKDNCFIYGKEDDGMKGTKFKKDLE
jgi:hypothetical protein